MSKILLTGHRGAPYLAPENTLPSFLKAIEIGVDYIELDVRLTKDGIPVVIHDPTVNRTTNGTGYVSLFTYENLKKLDAGSWFSKEYKGLRIPSLREALEFIDGRVITIIELKEDGIEGKVIEILEELGLKYKAIIASFDLKRIKEVRILAPSIPTTAITVDFNDSFLQSALSALANRIAINISSLNPKIVRQIHLHGLTVDTWVINDITTARKVIDMGIDVITSDRPELIRQILNS